MVQSVIFVCAFLALGGAVAFVAFSGGPSKAREAYLTSGRRFFRVVIPIIYIGLGIAVPAAVIAGSEQGRGGTPQLAGKSDTGAIGHGKTIFRQTCASCHSLAAVNARGITGPNLDNTGPGTPPRPPRPEPRQQRGGHPAARPERYPHRRHRSGPDAREPPHGQGRAGRRA